MGITCPIQKLGGAVTVEGITKPFTKKCREQDKKH